MVGKEGLDVGAPIGATSLVVVTCGICTTLVVEKELLHVGYDTFVLAKERHAPS